LCLAAFAAPSATSLRLDEAAYRRVRPLRQDAYRALLEDLVADPCDGLLIAPVLPEELLPALARLDAALPYAFFDADAQGLRRSRR